MTQEEKDLLLQDLCSRLPYNVRMLEIEPTNNIKLELYLSSITSQGTCCVSTNDGGIMCSSIDAFKPYLFPMSSMTDAQKTEWAYIDYYADHHEAVNWCNKNHLDYRGLIPLGLAIDATRLNIY